MLRPTGLLLLVVAGLSLGCRLASPGAERPGLAPTTPPAVARTATRIPTSVGQTPLPLDFDFCADEAARVRLQPVHLSITPGRAHAAQTLQVSGQGLLPGEYELRVGALGTESAGNGGIGMVLLDGVLDARIQFPLAYPAGTCIFVQAVGVTSGSTYWAPMFRLLPTP